jgi:hypothetical protein
MSCWSGACTTEVLALYTLCHVCGVWGRETLRARGALGDQGGHEVKVNSEYLELGEQVGQISSGIVIQIYSIMGGRSLGRGPL